MKLEDFLKIEYRDVFFTNSIDYQEQMTKINATEEKEIDTEHAQNYRRREFTNDKGKRYLLVAFDWLGEDYVQVYILKQNIEDKDVVKFILYARDLEELEKQENSKEKAIEIMKERETQDYYSVN